MPSLGSAAKAQGDGRMAAVACCGVDRSATKAALGSRLVVEGPTTLALLDAQSSVSEGALAIAASQVVLLEVRLADLMEAGPNGLQQLLPLLQRSVGLSPSGSKKLLLLAVVDYDPSDATESAVAATASAQLEQLWSRLGLPESASDAFDMEVCYLPHPAAAQFDESVAELKARFVAAEAGAYIFAEGRYSAPASSLLETAEALAAKPTPPPFAAASPADVQAAFACGQASDGAIKEFQKGLAAVRKAADASLLPDFGEQAAALLASAIERYEGEAAPLQSTAAFGATREALRAQLRRALLLPYRKQLGTLQKQTLAKFRQKLSATRPSAEIEAELAATVAEIKAGYEAQAVQLSAPSLGFEDGFERREMYEAFETAVASHVENLRVQGLYLPVKAVKLPVDFSAHWLMLNPFGKDARYDALDAKGDRPFYRPQASPMKLSIDKGLPMSGAADPKRMVFTDKMMN